MFTVALIGADGAGKTTIGRRLEQTLPVPAKYVYMGVNLDSSNHMLPTTRLIHSLKRAFGAKADTGGPPDPNQAPPSPQRLAWRIGACLKASLGLVVRISEEWFRQALAWYYLIRGNVVVFDRHFYADYYAYDVAQNNNHKTLRMRIHGWMLEHLYPKPDLVIFLDAPAEVLFARKREGTLAALEHRRQEYLQMCSVVAHFAVVDASRSQDEVALAVTEVIESFRRPHNRKMVEVENASS